MPNLPEFDPDGDPRNVSYRWTKWVHDFRAAMVSFKITCEKRQRALLRFYGGDELIDILESLDDTGTNEEIEPAIEALTRYFTPARNCEEEGHGGHAQDKECSGHVRGHGGEIHHFTRCCGSSVQFVRYTEGDTSNIKADTDEKSAKNTYKRETMTGNNQNTHTGKETKAAQEKKSPTREVKHENPPTREVKQKKLPNREVTQTKSPTREVKHEKSPTREVKHEKSPTREVKHENSPTREVKHEKSPKREVTQMKSPTRKVKLKDSHQGDVKQSDSHKRDVKPNDSHKRDVKQNDSHAGDVKHNDSHKRDVKQNDSHQGDVKQNGSHKDVKQNDSHKGDVKQNDSHKRDVKQNDSYKGDVNQKDSHKDVNKINRKHVRKRVVVDQNLHKRRDVNKINTGDEVKQDTTAVHTVIWKINNVSAGKSVKKKQICRRKKGKERDSAKKSHVKYSIIAGNKVHVKGKEYKSDVEPPDIRDREEPEQVVIQPRHHHKSRPPNSYNYVAN